MRRYKGALRLMTAASLSAALALFAAPATLLAAPDEVAGYDHILSGEVASDGSVDVLTVTGASGETVYLDIQQGGKTIASHLGFTLADENSETDENGELVGVVSVDPAAGVSLDGAKISVYADRAETELLYQGTISTVYARLGSGADAIEVPLAIRTLGEGESRAFQAPDSLDHGGVVYARVSDAPTTEGGKTYYAYDVSDFAAPIVDGHISFYDADDPEKLLMSQAVEGIGLGESRAVEVPSVITAEGGSYRTLQLFGTLTLSYPGTTEYTVMCKRLSDAGGQGATFRDAIIRYVDETGQPIAGMANDKVYVNKRYLYTPPTRLHVRNAAGEVVSYVLSAYNAQLSDGVLVLEPGDSAEAQTYDVVYEPLADDAERLWTVVLVNGSVGPKDPGREIERITYKGKPGETVTHETLASIDVGGTTYVPATATEDSYEHLFGVAELDTEQTIYYVPGNYVAPDAYDVTVKYVNIATNEVISSETYTASPTMRRDLEIVTPETFGKGGVEYIRLNGQELPIRHSFYAADRSYTVYYRDVNDTLHANTVITSVRPEYVDVDTGTTVRRTTTLVDGGTTVEELTEGGEGTEGTAADAATDGVQTGLATDDLLRGITDGTDSALVTNDGTELSTVRIEDDETPLASGLEGKQGATDAASAVSPATVGVIAGVGAAVAAVFLFFFIKRRKRSDEDTSSNDNANA